MERSKQQIVEDFIENFYKPRLIDGVNRIRECEICNFRDKIYKVINEGCKLLAFGNGGSEAIARQFLYSLNKPFANIEMADKINFNDSVLLISASGNSDNINHVALKHQEQGDNTMSISGKGKVIDKVDQALVIPENDQQIKEDIMQITIHILARLLNGPLYDCDDCTASRIKTNYINQVKSIFNQVIDANMLIEIIESIIKAYKEKKIVRVDSPGSNQTAISAEHIAHNLKWDALSNLESPVSNRVYSGLPSCHFSGVSNDGGDGYNHAIEIGSTMWEGDVLILFGNTDNEEMQRAIKAANKNNVTTHVINLANIDDDLAADITQITGHIMGRILNTFLLLDENSITIENVERQLESDLAKLRTKEKTKELLEQEFG